MLMAEVEARPYGPESTPAEREALRARVFVHSPGVLCWREIPVTTVWQVELMGERLFELLRDGGEFSLLIDLRQAQRPTAQVRRALRMLFQSAKELGLVRVVAFTEKNFLINVAAKFVLGGAGFPSFTVHSTEADARDALGIST